MKVGRNVLIGIVVGIGLISASTRNANEVTRSTHTNKMSANKKPIVQKLKQPHFRQIVKRLLTGSEALTAEPQKVTSIPSKKPAPPKINWREWEKAFKNQILPPIRPPSSEHILAGGPDGYGYVYESTQDGDTVTFNWIEISGTGTDLGLSDDDWISVSLSFSFPFYDASYNSVSVGSNGTVYFENYYVGLSNTGLPSNSYGGGDIIAVFWDDLNPAANGAVYFQDFGTYAVIEWYNVPRYGQSTYNTFEAIIYNDGRIKLQYLSMNGTYVDATIGIQDSSAYSSGNGWYLEYLYNGNPSNHIPTTNTAILFYVLPTLDHDVGVQSIDAPTGMIGIGTPVTPQATVKNYGANTETFTVTFEIYDPTGTLVYSDTKTVLALGPGSSTAVTFNSWTPAMGGTHTDTVYTSLTGDQYSANDTMGSSFFAQNVGTDYLIIDLDPTPLSGLFVNGVLQNLGYAGVYSTDPADLTYANMSSYTTVWLFLGIYSNNYSLSTAEVDTIRQYLLNGGRMYVEGGDCWGFDASRWQLDSLFGIDPANTADGTNDLYNLMGLTSPVPNVSEADTFAYSGENNWIDRLALLQQVPFPGVATPFLYNYDSDYYTGVAYTNTTYNAVGLSHEIAGDDPNNPASDPPQDSLVSWIMQFLTGSLFPEHDLGMYSINSPSCIYTEPGSSQPVSVTVINNGIYTENTYTVYASIDDPGSGTNHYYWFNVINYSLAPGDTHTVNLADWTVPTDSHNFVMRAWVSLTGDNFAFDDTLRTDLYNWHFIGQYVCNTIGPYNTAASGSFWLGDMAYDPTRGYFYQVDVGGNNGILVIDANVVSDAFGDSLNYMMPPTGGWTAAQRGIAYNPDSDHIYIGSWDDQTLWIVDAATNSLIGSWNIGINISGLAWDDDSSRLYIITNSNPDMLYIVDPYTQTTIASYTVSWGGGTDGYDAAGLAYAGNGKLIAVNQYSNSLEVLDAWSSPGTSLNNGQLTDPTTHGWGVGYIDGTQTAWISQVDPSTFTNQEHWVGGLTLCTATCGDVNNDGFVDGNDASYLANYANFGGPAPVTGLHCADVNNDGFVDGNDASYLANYANFGGPAPNCP